MIALNVLHCARMKLSMNLKPHLPVPSDCTPPPLSSCLPPLPHAPLLSLSSPFLLPPPPHPPPFFPTPPPSPSPRLPPPLSFLSLPFFPFMLSPTPPSHTLSFSFLTSHFSTP